MIEKTILHRDRGLHLSRPHGKVLLARRVPNLDEHVIVFVVVLVRRLGQAGLSSAPDRRIRHRCQAIVGTGGGGSIIGDIVLGTTTRTGHLTHVKVGSDRRRPPVRELAVEKPTQQRRLARSRRAQYQELQLLFASFLFRCRRRRPRRYNGHFYLAGDGIGSPQ